MSKTGLVALNQFSSKTCQLEKKLDFEITFIKFQLFTKNFKNMFTTLVLQKSFSISRFSIKLSNYQNITETYNKLSI